METKATKREVKQEVKNKVRTFATSSRSGINYIDAQKYSRKNVKQLIIKAG